MTDYLAIVFTALLFLLFSTTYAIAQEPAHTTAWYEAHTQAAKAQYQLCMKRVNKRLDSGHDPIDVSAIWTRGECKQVAQAIHRYKMTRREVRQDSVSID
ncbi:hypothetical protein [Carnimonas nigrificans]|uniref:hypothetical protein n=1 Tax=Carnimonas nigrificans TaxID=64323 RepID=UPI0012ECA805|nr:hypothetical protein [Carnimonas nigrificans]